MIEEETRLEPKADAERYGESLRGNGAARHGHGRLPLHVDGHAQLMALRFPSASRRCGAEGAGRRRMHALALPFALLVSGTACGATNLEAAAGPRSARSYAEAFRDICLAGGFDPDQAGAALQKLGWRGTILQRPTPQAPFTHWRTPFGELQVGYRTIGGINLRKYNCSIVITKANAPAPADMEASLETVLAPARFEDLKPSHHGPHRLARLTDRDEEQAYLLLSSGNVPLIEAGGAIALRPGILIDYSYAKGPHARESTGR